MDEVPIPSGVDKVRQQFLAQYDAPPYARRALRVQQAWEQLLGRCRQQRDQWLHLVRVRLGLLHGLAGDWSVVSEFLEDGNQVGELQRLHECLAPRLRAAVQRTASARVVRRALRDLGESLERFNQRWRQFVPSLDLTEINQLRDGYNRYYVLEKECAVRSARLARQGFQRLEPVTHEHLLEAMPFLPVPRLKE